MTERLPSPNKAYPFVGPNYQQYGEVKGYVYSPYTDSYYIDPRSVQSQYESQGLLKKQKDPTLVDQVLPIAASAGAYYGGKMLADKVGNAFSSGGSAATSGGAQPLPDAPAAATPLAPNTTAAAPNASISGNTVAPQAPAGSVPAAPPAETPTDWNAMAGKAGQVAQGALGAYQVYQGAKDFKKDKPGGLLSIGSGAANVGASMGSKTAGQAAGPLMIAKGGYDTYNSLQHGGQGIRAATTTLGAGIGSVVPGVGTVIGAGIGNILGYGLQGNSWKNKAALAVTSPLLLGAKMLGYDPVHKTTKQYKQERWGNLVNRGVINEDAAYQAIYGQGDGTWETGKYAGQKWSFEKAQDLARQDPTHFQNVYGNLDTFGADWANYTDEQQKAITAGLVANGLYKSNKGDIVVKDKAAAMKIKDQVLAGAPPEAAKPSGKPSNKPSMIENAQFKQPTDKTKLKGLLGV